jgi:hypothetical protein
MDRDSTLGLNPERLARLLGITLDSESDEERENPIHSTSELIRAHLAGRLPFDTTVIDDLPAIIGRLHKDLAPHAGRTLGDVLTDPKSDLDTIRKVRRYGKRMASRKSSEAKHAMAIAIYFAAIASALIFHDVKITTYSYRSLKASFGNLADKPWMPTVLIGLFTKGREVCRSKGS